MSPSSGGGEFSESKMKHLVSWLGCERCHLAELGIVIICEMSASERERERETYDTRIPIPRRRRRQEDEEDEGDNDP